MQTYRSLLRNLLVATTSPIAIAMVILFGLIAFTAYEQFTKDIPDVPAIKQGQLSLPSDQNMPISLQGNWRFYWQQLLTPQDLTDQYHLITVPSRWRDVNIDGISLSAPGFATYAATVEFDRRSRSLGLRLPVLYRAATVWVNGEVVAEIGRPGATAKEEIPRDEIKIIPLPNTAKKLQLVIQVSSFHHVDGGLSLPVVIDDLSRLEYAEKWRIVRGIFLLASVLTLSVYLLIMWAYANAGREYFYLGIGLFWYAVRIFGKERLIFYLYPDFSVEWQMRAVYFGMFLCVPAYMLFIQSLFPRDMSYRLFRIFWYTGVCASVFTALVGSSWYTQLRDPFELLALAFIAYFLLSLVRIVWLRREWSVVVGFLGGVTALLFINEVLFVKGLIAIQLTPWAYIFVALTSLIFLGQRMNVRLLTEAELGARLQTAVASQTQQLQNQIVELDAARRHAVDMARRRTEFMAILSHEVRTPLSGLLGALRLWGQKDKSVSDDTLQQHALVAGESLLAVVNNTLDVTSMEHRQVLTHTCQQLNHCFASIATIMAISANNKNLEFIFTGPDDEYTATWVLADFQKLRQITINLLSNAIKFTRSGQVMLKVSLFERERFPGDISHIDGDKLLIIKVTDTGIGMPAKLLPRIFDAYVQLGHSGDTNSANGSGLGLAITRQLVELHGGAIEVDSEPGQGSCFTVIVPVEDCVPDVFRHAPLQEAVAGLRILVVEDDEVNRTVVSALLQQDGNKVVATGSPAQALRQLQGFPFDVLLLDIRLPEMSGLTLLGHARAQATTTMRPLYVALTANTSGQDVEKYRQAGFDYVLEKPVDRTQLRFVLSRVGAGEDKDGGFLLRNHLSQALQPDAPIDWEFWLGVVSDLGVERAARLLETAKSSLRETIAAMVSSDVSQAPAGVSDLAHKLKSAARSVGMLKVAFIAGTIEINPALSPSLSEDLQRAIDEALRLLSANLSRRHNE